MSDVIVALDFPIQDGQGNTLTELTPRRPKAKDLRAAQSQKTEVEQEFFLLAQLAGLVMEDIGELDMADYQKVQQALQDMQKGKSK